MHGEAHVGFFGKIPAHGDFVQHHLTPEFVNQWDQWLQSGITSSKVQLGEAGWLDISLTSPVWHFALCQGVCSDQAWVGNILPSVDRVGRYYPLTLAVPIIDNDQLFAVARNDEDWFSTIEQIALSTLEQTLDVEHFKAGVDSLAAPPSARGRRSWPTAHRPSLPDGSRMRCHTAV